MDLSAVLALLPLAPQDRRACALVSTSWKAGMDAAWAHRGISVRDNATNVLLQERWNHLVALHVWGPAAPADRTPFHGLPAKLPALWKLSLRRVQLAAMPGVFANVFRQAPRLRHVDLRIQMWAATYPNDLRNVRSLLLAGAAQLEYVALRGEGLVIYPTEPYVCRRDDAFFAAQESRSWLPVAMPHLHTYVNTGKNFSMLAVDAPLREATIEEPDAGVWLAQRLGPTCTGLRTLTWIVPQPSWRTAFPMLSVAQRFTRLLELNLTVRVLSSPKNLELVLDSLTSLPQSLQRLRLKLEQSFWPYGPCDWRKDTLAHLRSLRHLELWVGYATCGFEDAFGLLGAAPDTAVVGAVHADFPEIDDASESDADDADPGPCMEMSRDRLQQCVRAVFERLPGLHLTTRNLLVCMRHPRLCVK